MVKNGRSFIDHGYFKSGVSHKLFDELSRLNDLCMLIVME